jgi:sugar diacid utilization regulator
VVCKVLVEESAKINSRESILTSILYSENPDVADIMKQASYLGISLSGKHRVAVFKMYDTQQGAEMSEDSGSTIETRENVKKLIESEFRLHGLKKLLIHLQMDSIALMLPSELFSNDLIISIFGNIIKKTSQSYKIGAKVGIGSDYEYIAELKNSYQEACDTIQILNTVSSLKNISFYEDLGLYSLISQIKNGKFLDDYINTKLGALIDADKMQAGELCTTLENYLECNCNANATAEVLYIHRNTMRYRLEKIKGVLGNNLSDLSTIVELKLAFAIKDYREKRNE